MDTLVKYRCWRFLSAFQITLKFPGFHYEFSEWAFFSFSFFTVFNNWFLIRRHISLSGLDLSRIQHLTANNLHGALRLIFVHYVLFVPLCSTVQRWKVLRKLPACGRSEEKHLVFWEKVSSFKNVSQNFDFRDWSALFCMAIFFLYTLLHLCQGVKACDFMYFVQAKWARAEVCPPLQLWVVCGVLLGIVPRCSHLVFSYFPHGSFFLYLICWL